MPYPPSGGNLWVDFEEHGSSFAPVSSSAWHAQRDSNLTPAGGYTSPACYHETQSPIMPVPDSWVDVTTVMVRNLPNKYTRQEFLKEVDQNFANTYDFVYLPIDQQHGANKGYAFINFVDPCYCLDFRNQFDGKKMELYNSKKVVSVGIASLQGFEANYAHYSKTRVGTGRKQARPLFLRKPGVETAPGPGVDATGRRAASSPDAKCVSSPCMAHLNDGLPQEQAPCIPLVPEGEFGGCRMKHPARQNPAWENQFSPHGGEANFSKQHSSQTCGSLLSERQPSGWPTTQNRHRSLLGTGNSHGVMPTAGGFLGTSPEVVLPPANLSFNRFSTPDEYFYMPMSPSSMLSGA